MQDTRNRRIAAIVCIALLALINVFAFYRVIVPAASPTITAENDPMEVAYQKSLAQEQNEARTYASGATTSVYR